MTLRTDRLRTLREQHGWSQRELARFCGLGTTQIFKYENGYSDPSSTNLELIATQLNVSVDFLLGRTDNPRSYLGDEVISGDERIMIDVFRREGWSGVARLSVERLSK
ncbi:MAG: helix-turn-helix domain-containing protein [Aggregatilineales bacterium]